MTISFLQKSLLTAVVVTCLGIVTLRSNPVATEPPDDQSKAVEALKDLEKRTGKTANELLPAIEISAGIVAILAEDLKSGAVTKEELTDLKSINKNIMTAVEQDLSMDATTKLVALRSINGGQVEDLKKWLREGIVKRYVSTLSREDKTAMAYRSAVDKEAAKDEELAKALSTAKTAKKTAEQDDEGQSATHPELDSEGAKIQQPEVEHRSR
jgi:hypothetical protein